MMITFKLFNTASLKRALLVGSAAALFCSVLGILLSNMLDQMYRVTESDFFYAVFYTLSTMKPVVIAVVWTVIIALFSNWIFYPSFLGFSRAIAQSLVLDETAEPARLPKQFQQLEQELAGMHKELQLWKYATQEAEKRKDELVVYLAHDIRTPLTSVLGYLELLAENPDLPPQNRQKFTATALRKAQRMQALVEELFEVTRFNISHIELRREAVRSGVLLQQLAEEMAPVLEEKQLAVDIKVDSSPILFIDPAKTARALDNILHNAAYYSPEGGTIEVAAETAEGVGVIHISNKGAEISQSELDRFFEKFYRGDTARQSKTGGSGLGLAIAKNILEAQGGQIFAHNANHTTTFEVHLPLAKQAENRKD